MTTLKFTFGIITSNYTCNYMPQVLNSIYSIEGMNKENFEIIIVGGPPSYGNNWNFIHIPFDDSPKNVFKKNLITKKSSMENIVFIHDYINFDNQWYNGFFEFGNCWDLCMNMILNYDDSRFNDWVLWDAPENQKPEGKIGLLAPYSYDNFQYMYISGTFFIAKKFVMEEEPFNKWLQQCECEDLEWSKRVLRKGYKYKMNPLSVVKVLKPYKKSFGYMS
jgi:hypothetical protein